MIIFTTGYERRSLEDFLTELRAAGIRHLVDVRDAPISRKPGFSKAALAEGSRAAGIAYTHLRALGCPKPIRDAFRRDGDWDRYTRAYLDHMRRQQPALAELAALSAAEPTALLCYEADFNRCHRTYVARAVAERSGALVRHITASGILEDGSTWMGSAGRPGGRRRR
jgi:uncharacterized protein (DUF488 family)